MPPAPENPATKPGSKPTNGLLVVPATKPNDAGGILLPFTTARSAASTTSATPAKPISISNPTGDHAKAAAAPPPTEAEYVANLRELDDESILRHAVYHDLVRKVRPLPLAEKGLREELRRRRLGNAATRIYQGVCLMRERGAIVEYVTVMAAKEVRSKREREDTSAQAGAPRD